MILFKLWKDTKAHAIGGLGIVLAIAIVQAVIGPRVLPIFGLDPTSVPHLPLLGSIPLPDPHSPGFASSAWWLLYLNVVVFIALLFGIASAGSGLSSRTVDGKIMHPSVIYTLSLPVTRRRWLAARAALGHVQFAFLILLLLIIPAALAPFTGGHFSWVSALTSFPFMIVGASVFYALSTFLATFLEERWQVLASMIVVLGLTVIVSSGRAQALNIFRFMAGFNPSLLGAAACLALTAVFFAGAIRVVQRQEF